MFISDRLQGTTSPNQGKTSIKSLCLLGDSWTDALWAGVPKGAFYKPIAFICHWSTILEKEMRIPMWNHGIAGDTSAGVLSRLQQAIDLKPSHCTLMVGGNDIFGGASSDSVMANITTTYNRLTSAGIKVILMCYPINPFGAPSDFPRQWQEIVGLRNKTYAFSQKTGCTFVDFFNTPMYNGSNGVNESYYMPDRVHANTIGSRMIADFLLTIINKGGI